MRKPVYRIPSAFADDEGTVYDVHITGEPHGHVWHGWIEFHARDGRVLSTDRETTQPSRGDLIYWAEGLEPIYFEGAFARAQRHEGLAPLFP